MPDSKLLFGQYNQSTRIIGWFIYPVRSLTVKVNANAVVQPDSSVRYLA